MNFKQTRFFLLAAVLIIVGCEESKKESDTPAATKTAAADGSAAKTIARIHWLGKKQISQVANATNFMAVWNLPESARLEAQTLDKLAVAPWRWLGDVADRNSSSPATNLLRGLLNDVVGEECYIGIGPGSDRPGELILAIRLSDERAALWETNLATVCESLTRVRPAPAGGGKPGWSVKWDHFPQSIRFTRAGQWTIVDCGTGQETVLTTMLASIQRSRVPFAAAQTNAWLEADIDLQPFATYASLAWSPPEGWPRVSVTMTDDGDAVRTQGDLKFAKPLTLDLQAWDLPKSLITESPSSFTVARGFKPLLTQLKAWNDLGIGEPPDQICVWADGDSLQHTYFSSPMADASNEVLRLTQLVLEKGESWFATNEYTKFESSKSVNGLEWKGLPYLWPFVQSTVVSNRNYVYGGVFPAARIWPAPEDFFTNVLSATNRVFYDWEMTGFRINQWTYIGQFIRFASYKTQLPFESTGLLCLKAMPPKLGSSVTDVTYTSPDRLSFSRKSTIGFTAVELHLLADWLESERFPCGLKTFEPTTNPAYMAR